MAKFSPPSQEEVVRYFIEKRFYNPEKEALKFWNRYDAVDWVVGKSRTPMVRWKSAAANWNENAVEFAKEKGIQIPHVPKPKGGYVTKQDRKGTPMPDYMKGLFGGIQ